MKNKKLELWKVCEKFIAEQQINCPESVYQCDNVILNAYSFIEDICNIVGYHKFEDEDK
jgi:hypothetical protein